jgi:hypothetical protein
MTVRIEPEQFEHVDQGRDAVVARPSAKYQLPWLVGLVGFLLERLAALHLHGHDRQLVSMFMALQIARSREHIAQTAFSSELAEFTEERPPSREIVHRFINERHGHTPEDAEVEAARTLATFEMQEFVASFDTAFSVSMKNATTRMAPLLDGLHWRVETVDAPVLWTSDRPVMPWRPPSSRDRFEGVGYGNADEIRMPLSPAAMLILQRRASQSPVRVDKRRFHAYERDIALQCYEFVVCLPGRRARLDTESMAPNRPAVRFHRPSSTLRRAVDSCSRRLWGVRAAPRCGADVRPSSIGALQG